MNEKQRRQPTPRIARKDLPEPDQSLRERKEGREERVPERHDHGVDPEQPVQVDEDER